MKKLLLKNGYVIDPSNKIDGKMDILIEAGKISRISGRISSNGAEVINLKGKVVIPGLIDMHTHLREPGREDEETVASGTAAAAKGGFTAVLAMPNTEPVIDNEGVAELINSIAAKRALVKVYPVGAATKGLGGRELSEIGVLQEAGIAAISDDGGPIQDMGVMRRVLEYGKMFGMLFISHPEDMNLSEAGVMNEGFVSTVLGLRGIPGAAESSAVAQCIEVIRLTRARVHFAHISTARSVELIRLAKKQGLKVSAETCPHYFSLSEEDVREFGTNTKMNPPLRTKEDIRAIKRGLKDGTIDVIATDHAPHSDAEKELEFDNAPFGITGLETAFSLGITELVKKRALSLQGLVEKMALNPARILGMPFGIASGRDADITVFDMEKEWEVRKEDFYSKSSNSPFIGRRLKGRITMTLCRGKIAYSSPLKAQEPAQKPNNR